MFSVTSSFRKEVDLNLIMKSHCCSSMLAAVILVLALLPFHKLVTKAEQCLPGKFHKKTSSPGGNDYAECRAWNKDTCCTANFTIKLNKTRVRNLYNFHWGHCKNLSLACERYILAEECFYSCEPRLIRWQVVNTSLAGIPVCGDYCDEWYRACENDQTCVEDWFSGFNITNNAYACPRGSECRTFKQIYGNGTNLCNKMWGKTFVYADPRDCPCTRLDGPIPSNVTDSFTCCGSFLRQTILPVNLLLVIFGLAIKVFVD